MTTDEALTLARRMANCWHAVPVAEWADVLTPLDAHAATATYERLRSLLEHAPSVPRFMSEYASVTAGATPTPVPQWQPADRRLTREQRIAILEANGAPPKYTRREARL